MIIPITRAHSFMTQTLITYWKMEERFKNVEPAIAQPTTESHLDRYDQNTLGCPDHTLHLASADAISKLLKSTGGDRDKITEKLGVDWPGESPLKVIYIENGKEFLMTMAGGNEFSANNKFKYGGKTINGVPEIVLHKKVPEGRYMEFSPEQFVIKHPPKEDTPEGDTLTQELTQG